MLHEGVDAIFSLCPGPMSIGEAISRAEELLARATTQAVRCFLVGRASGVKSG